ARCRPAPWWSGSEASRNPGLVRCESRCRRRPCGVRCGRRRMADCRSFQVARFQAIPGFQHQAPGTVFAELLHLVVLEHPEGFRRVVFAHHIGGVEDVTEFIARKTVGTSKPGVELCAEL